MAMQTLVDEKVGRLWSERRAYSGSVIRRAAELEGRKDVENGDIDDLLNRYSMWLLNNLANPANAEILDPAARDAASDMIGDVCAGLYAQADRAILKKHPSLGACTPGQTPLPALSGTTTEMPGTCEGDSAILAATSLKQAEDTVAEMLGRLQTSQARTDELSNELALLQIDNDRLLREIDTNRIVSTRVDDLTVANEQLRAEITRLETERDRLAATAENLQDLQQENTRLTAKADALRQNMEGLVETNDLLGAEIGDLTARHRAALARVDTLTGELAAVRTAMIAAPTSAEMASTSAKLATARRTLDDITADRDRMAEELAVATATLETMTGTTPARRPVVGTTITADDMPGDLALLDADMAPAPRPAQALAEMDAVRTSVSTTPDQDTDFDPERSFVAQLGAFSSRTGASSEISRIQTSFPDKSALAALRIFPSQRDDGTSIFRITTGEMAAEDLQRLCGELWTGMVSCMLRAAP